MNDLRNPNNRNNEGNRRRRRRRHNGRRRDERGPEDSQDEALSEVKLAVPEDQIVLIGLTGEPGAGKTTLAKAFTDYGATIIDVDALGREVIDTPANKRKLCAAFGDDILGEDKAIDRAALAAKAFADADAVAILNDIVNAPLIRKVKAALKKAGNFVIIDAARLHELGLAEDCKQTVYVQAPLAQRLTRCAERGWDEEELRRRDAALGSVEERRQRCSLAVDNKGGPELLAVYARTILARILDIDLTAIRRGPTGGGNGGNPNGSASPTAAPAAAVVDPDREPVHVVLDDFLVRILPDLQKEGERMELRDVNWLPKHDLICEILRRTASGRLDDILVDGYVELGPKGQNAYLRSPLNKYIPCNTDTFITNLQLRRYGLYRGMYVTATARAPRGNETCPQLLNVLTVMGEDVNQRTHVRPFKELTPLHATQRLFMERHDQPTDYSLRILDLVAPIGKGQRGLIVSQPKAGKTIYLQKMANAIVTNNPEVTLMILLVDERPEEVTDMERSVPGAEVIASTFDQHSSRHVQIAEMAINKARRLVERGADVVILLDSITRLARAYNSEAPSSGRIMSGGIESSALIRPKQFFGSARNIEDGGSLTILATTLVDTGSVMDTVIFEEFKGTGNMEIILDRRLANKRIFPAVDVAQSGTRKDELIVTDPEEHRRMWALRRWLAERSSQDAIEFLKSKLKNYKTNIEFLMALDPDKMSGW